MPDALELPRMRLAVVPLVRAGISLVYEHIALTLGHSLRRFFGLTSRRLESLSAIVGTLNDLAEPSAGLRCINPIRIDRRALDVIDFPPRKQRPLHVPILSRA